MMAGVGDHLRREPAASEEDHVGLVGGLEGLLRRHPDAVPGRHALRRARDLRAQAARPQAIEDRHRDEGIDLVEAVEGDDGDAHDVDCNCIGRAGGAGEGQPGGT